VNEYRPNGGKLPGFWKRIGVVHFEKANVVPIRSIYPVIDRSAAGRFKAGSRRFRNWRKLIQPMPIHFRSRQPEVWGYAYDELPSSESTDCDRIVYTNVSYNLDFSACHG
jgi:hypothetical protein